VYTLTWLWKYNRNSGIKAANTPDRNDVVGTSSVLLEPPVWINQMYVISATQETPVCLITIQLRNMLYKLNSLPGILSNKKIIRIQRTARLQVRIISERVTYNVCSLVSSEGVTRTPNAYWFCLHKFRVLNTTMNLFGYDIWHLWSVKCLSIIEV
jgi:hypothetical protein